MKLEVQFLLFKTFLCQLGVNGDLKLIQNVHKMVINWSFKLAINKIQCDIIYIDITDKFISSNYGRWTKYSYEYIQTHFDFSKVHRILFRSET